VTHTAMAMPLQWLRRVVGSIEEEQGKRTWFASTLRNEAIAEGGSLTTQLRIMEWWNIGIKG
jgi:hypothetical protein